MAGRRALSLRYQGARLRAFGKRRGSSRIRALIWNWEFLSGQWRYLENFGDSMVCEVVTRYLDGGHLLDLGCGNGAVRCELPVGSVARYVGVDLSSEAIRRTAERSSVLPELDAGQLLIVGDIADPSVIAQAGGPFDVVLLRESIYFVNVERLPQFLTLASERLSSRGVIVIKIHDRLRYSRHVDEIRRTRSIVEEHAPTDGTAILLVAR